jgi:hypothetical protein
METQRKKQTQRQKNAFTMTSGGFVIAVRIKYFIDSKIAFFRAYLVTILKALLVTIYQNSFRLRASAGSLITL